MKAEIYSKDNCSFCDRAKTLLKQKNIDYSEFKIGVNLTREQFFERFPNARTVPQIVIDDVDIGGYDQLVNRLNG